MGAGERALLVAEQIGLDERLGDGGRVDGDEGPVTPRALMVDGPRDQLLAGSALAGDQDGGRRPGDLRDQAVELLDRGMPTDDLVEVVRARQLGAQECDLALERPALEGASRKRQELVLLEGLGQIVEGAELHGGHCGAHGLHGGDEDHLDALVERLDALEHLDTVHPGQSDVEQDEVDRGGPDDVERAGAVGHVDDFVVVLEDQPKRLPNAWVVIDDEDDGARHARTLAPISLTQMSSNRDIDGPPGPIEQSPRDRPDPLRSPRRCRGRARAGGSRRRAGIAGVQHGRSSRLGCPRKPRACPHRDP